MVFEASRVLEAHRDYEGALDFEMFEARAGMKLAEMDTEQTEIAGTTFYKFGKRRDRHQPIKDERVASPSASPGPFPTEACTDKAALGR